MKTTTRKSPPRVREQRGSRARPRRFALKRILVPLDFSKQSMQALNYAVPLALQHGAKITLIHVVRLTRVATPPMMAGELSESPDVVRSLVEHARSTLNKIAAEELPPDLATDPVVKTGVAWDEIVRAARAWPADLVVIATHGFTGLKHVLIGSTAERVVRAAPCPVLTVRQREKGPPPRLRGG